MRIVRKITYEGTEEQIRRQLRASLAVGEHQWGKSTAITIEHVEGPRFVDENDHRKLVDGNADQRRFQ